MRSNFTLLAASVFGLALPVASSALAGERLTLTAAVETALRSNPELLRAQAQQGAAAAGKREATALRLPHLQVRELGQRTDSPADAFGLQLMQERFSFPTFTTSDPNDPDPIENFTTQFEASWPIFTGGRVMAAIGQADRMAQAADAVHGHTREAIALATASAYTDAVLAQRAVELAQRARDTTARHVDEAEAFFDAGMVVESDLLQARVQLARMEEKLISATNAAQLARAGLFRGMGIGQDAEYELDSDVPDVQPAVNSLSEALVAAQQRHDVRAVAAQVDAARLGVRRAQGEYLPEVALVARYSLNDDRPFGDNGDSYALMAMAQWNVWNWGQTRARVSGARFQHVAAQHAQSSHQQQVEFDVRQAWQQVAEAKARAEVNRVAVGQAEKALSILEARFEQGVARITDLLDAETMLDDARVRDLNARFDAQRATRTLYFAVGLSLVPEVLP